MHHAKLPFGQFAHKPDVVRPSKVAGNRHTKVLHRLAGDNWVAINLTVDGRLSSIL